jgi:hypothetical protein
MKGGGIEISGRGIDSASGVVLGRSVEVSRNAVRQNSSPQLCLDFFQEFDAELQRSACRAMGAVTALVTAMSQRS